MLWNRKIRIPAQRALFAAIASLSCAPGVLAGDFQFDWTQNPWPAGNTGPLSFTLTDQYGFDIEARISASGNFSPAAGTTTPDDMTIFGGSVDSLVLVSDAAQGNANIGEATVSSTFQLFSQGQPLAVDGLTYDVLDIDASDNNASSDRCDFVTITGDNGDPLLTAVSAAPAVNVGPGAGSGLTGPLAANQAQCIYLEGSAVSPTSNNDDTGTVRVLHPDGTSSATVTYDESVGNVRSFVFNEDPAARGIGVWAATFFAVGQNISLSRSASPGTAVAGSAVTYTYTITNDGPLPFNPAQDIVIQDDQLGTVTCPAITSEVAPGGTVTCTAEYTFTAADVLAGSASGDATAGIGPIGAAFADRLQSNTASISVLGAGDPPPPSPLTCTPVNVFDAPRTQIAGSGSAAAVNTSDIFLFDNVTSDADGNPIDVLFQLESVNAATNVELQPDLNARMTPVDNAFVTYRLSLVQDGSATTANPQGLPINQSRINGIIVQQTDIDSRGSGDDSSDVGGALDGTPQITHFNTAPLSGFPASANAISQDPAKAGNPLDWVDEINETNFDNFVTYEFATFDQTRFIHGYTGTSTNPATRGSSILLCAIAGVSADVRAEDDSFLSTPINGAFGGTAGEALANDTINGVPATPLNAELEVLVPASPAIAGEPVPFLQTSGVDLGRVVVPANTPSGIYSIDYELCDAFAPTDCDRAQISVAVFDGIGIDYGDAPLSYFTPTHSIPAVPTVFLGVVPPDAETFTQADGTATGDDAADTDDEEGVNFPILTQGAGTTLDVAVTGNGFLQGWIDFNGDGVFEDALGERIATDLRDDGTGDDTIAGDGIIQVNVSVPVDATTTLTFSRFRFASASGLDFSTFAQDGEVEDYSLVIAAADLVDRGDAPASYGDPRHAVVPEIYLGAGLPDTDVTPQHSANADADDLNDQDDEDGVSAMPTFNAGSTASVTVTTRETLGTQFDLGLAVTEGITNLQMWIDFDQNGVFDPAEHVALDARDGGAGDADGVFNQQITLAVPVPSNAADGQTIARLRWSTTSGVTSDPFNGFNADGEVEDYLVTVVNPSAPLSCNASFYMVAIDTAVNNPALKRLTITESGGSFSLSEQKFPTNTQNFGPVTGWGYNELDGYIYGVRESPDRLLRVDASGTITEVADLTALNIELPFTAADILPNGTLVYLSAQNPNQYHLLDLTDPANPSKIGFIDVVDRFVGKDIGYNPLDGWIYFIDGGRNLRAFDPNGGTAGVSPQVQVASFVPLPPGFNSLNVDSVWFDAEGFMYVFDTTSSQIFAMEVGGDGARPASFEFFEVNGALPASTSRDSDGASCRRAGPFTPTVVIGAAVSGTVYEDADGSGDFSAGDTGIGAGVAVSIFDENGTPADPADDTLVGTVDTDANGGYSLSGLDDAPTYRIEVDTADPDIPAGLVIATPNPLTGVVLVQGEVTGSQDFGFVPANATADLSLQKAALDGVSGTPITEAAEGTEIDFVLTVENAGPSGTSDVTVIDLIPDGFVYVSDDAAAIGDSYDPATGLWTLGDLAAGDSAALTIRVTMAADGAHTNVAEITGSSAADPDSDPGVGRLVDDLGDEIADDDEAFVTVTYLGGGQSLSGTLFHDSGAGGGDAFDGIRNGTEAGSANGTITVLDAASAVIGTAEIGADGAWSLPLPDGFSGDVTVLLTPDSGFTAISEAPVLPVGANNAAPRDGAFSFFVDPGQSYAGLDFGMIRDARLTQSQQAEAAPGQVVILRHTYFADAAGLVDFSAVQQSSTPAGAFAIGVYSDPACDGDPGSPINEPMAVAAGTEICVIARVSSTSGAGPGATVVFDLIADTSYTGTGHAEQDRNTDRVTVDAGEGLLTLSKSVNNLAQGGGEGVSNGASVGDVLEYRIYLKNSSPAPARNITIFDRTPPYTSLAEPVPSPVAVSPSLTCTVTEPGANTAGYAGALRWDCTGEHQPGARGFVAFRVKIDP